MRGRGWFDRLLSSIADRGRHWVRIPTDEPPLEQVRQLSKALLSEGGEASGAALARALVDVYQLLDDDDRQSFHGYLAREFAPNTEQLRAAAEAYLRNPSADAAMLVAEAAEPPRQELLRRMNMAPRGTASLVAMRAYLASDLKGHPELKPLDADLRHLLASWFNRGFLELRRIDWHTPAAVLEKLIDYEAVHEIQGWDDLRRRLAPDRRCFAFFHPALADEPLIFVEVALVQGIASAIQPLLARDQGAKAETTADTAIFYSISNCQRGLRGISFGNFLIKQVVEDLKQELPKLTRFATLSPVPGFRSWLEKRAQDPDWEMLRPEERSALKDQADDGDLEPLLLALASRPNWYQDLGLASALKAPLMRLCADYLTDPQDGKGPSDPVARFHLGNGAVLERVNFLGNLAPRGLKESFGLMVNYLYDLDRIEANHEAFIRDGAVAHSAGVAELMRPSKPARGVAQLLSLGRDRRSAIDGGD
jgi:malonyl-CoA decarboxylase